MPHGDKSSYADKQKPMAAHIMGGLGKRPYAAGKGGEIRFRRAHG